MEFITIFQMITLTIFKISKYVVLILKYERNCTIKF